MARKLGFPALLGPPGRDRDLAYALIISRVLRPGLQAVHRRLVGRRDPRPRPGVAGASTDEIYAAMDWLVSRQDDVEKQLAARHLHQGGIAMFDLSSSWMEGTHCELAAFGYSRDGKRGKPQIEYGLLTDREGRPVAVRVFPGSTADPKAFPEAVTAVRQNVRPGQDDHGRGPGHDHHRPHHRPAGTGGDGVDHLPAPPGDQEAHGRTAGRCSCPCSMSRTWPRSRSPDFPGERLIACRNPFEAAKRARTRGELLAATEADLEKIAARAAAGRIKDPDKIGVAAGKIINKRKVAKHFILDIGEGRIAWRRDQASIDAEAATDGIYVIRTPVPAETLDAAGTVAAYKDLARLERDFRHLKADDLDLRPIWHRLEDRVKAHVLICMLACHLIWHLRQAWAPLTFTDEHPPGPRQPRRPRPPLRGGRRQSRPQDRPRQPAHPQLPRPDRPPRHPGPRHHHRRRPARRQARQPDPRPAPRLRPDRRVYTPHPHVDTSHPRQTIKSQVSGMKAPKPA